jgi:superfamily I DNA/RNA helicase
VLIDEAHDFEPEWLSLAVKMVDPNTRAFLIAYDDMPAIYKGMGRPVWSQLGIEAKGWTRVLKVNYRNTVEILRLAQRVAACRFFFLGHAPWEEAPRLARDNDAAITAVLASYWFW